MSDRKVPQAVTSEPGRDLDHLPLIALAASGLIACSRRSDSGMRRSFFYSHLVAPSPRSEFLEKATGLSVRLSLGVRGEGAGRSGRPTRLEI